MKGEFYKSKINKLRTSVQKEYYCHANNNLEKEDISIPKDELINKINNIFKMPNYVYQADVNIIYKNKENKHEKIIGLKDNSIMTLDGKKIPLDDIADIK